MHLTSLVKAVRRLTRRKPRTHRSRDNGLERLCDDALSVIIDYLDTPDWLQFSYTCRRINQFKYDGSIMWRKKRTMLNEIIRHRDRGRAAVRRSFRAATGTLFNVSIQFSDFADDDLLACIRGTIHTFDMTYCEQDEISDRTLEHMEGTIRVLRMSRCYQITDAAFRHLAGTIEELDISYCTALTDAAFQHLGGLRRLAMAGCKQETLTDRAFTHLRGLCHLDMSWCTQLTDHAFEPLTGTLLTLNMRRCVQRAITDRAFSHVGGSLVALHMEDCDQPTITDRAFSYMGNTLIKLNMSGCRQTTITDAAFRHLHALRILYMVNCTQETITDAALCAIGGVVEELNISMCKQKTITDAGFAHLAGMRVLGMEDCNEETVTEKAVLSVLHQSDRLRIIICRSSIVPCVGDRQQHGDTVTITSGWSSIIPTYTEIKH
jgi:hypothetical protein